MKIRWAGPARADLNRAADQLAEHDPELAKRLVNEARLADRFLAGTPRAGAPIGDGHWRKWRLATMPYMLLYRVGQDDLTVYRFVHIRSDWASLA